MPTIKQALESGVKFVPGDCLEKVQTSGISLIKNESIARAIKDDEGLSDRKVKSFFWRSINNPPGDECNFLVQLKFKYGETTITLDSSVVDWDNDETERHRHNPITQWRPSFLTWGEEEPKETEQYEYVECPIDEIAYWFQKSDYICANSDGSGQYEGIQEVINAIATVGVRNTSIYRREKAKTWQEVAKAQAVELSLTGCASVRNPDAFVSMAFGNELCAFGFTEDGYIQHCRAVIAAKDGQK